MKKLLLFLSFFFIPLICKAEETVTQNLAINSAAAILIEYSTGNVLYEKDANIKLAPASMTKIMTMLLIMESLESGKISLNDMIPISANASSMGGSQVFLEANSKIKLEDCAKLQRCV